MNSPGATPEDESRAPVDAASASAGYPLTPEAEAVPSDLPEWEPLSPELLEDEAIRGDFVLRGATVGLAFLYGCTQIRDARVLVHVRSGEWLASHGWLPGGNDPFSITAADRPWKNLSWLFDLLVAAIHQLSGPVGLSIAQGLLAVAAFAALASAHRPGIRTWWGSVCGALVLLCTYPYFALQPMLITLLGTSLLGLILVRSETVGRRSLLWLLAPLMFLWANLDDRAWLGGLMLIAYVAGCWWSSRRSHEAEPVEIVAKPVGLAFLVMGLHPLLGRPWLGPWITYGVDFPLLVRAYPRPIQADLQWHPLWSTHVWHGMDHGLASAFLLAVAAAATMLLNRPRTRAAHWVLWLTINCVGSLALRDFGVAAIINAVLATVNAQEWYLARFGQVYSIATSEVVFSRGGRAITVLAFCVLAWLSISGRINGPDGVRPGVGLSRALATELNDLRNLAGKTLDDHAFHFTLRQGDALIAAGRKSFVDHRVTLFAGTGDADLLRIHDQTRKSLRRSMATASEVAPDPWMRTADRFEVSHVLPRLNAWILRPDYDTFMDLLTTPELTLTELLPSVGVFHVARDASKSFIQHHALKPTDRAFHKSLLLNVDPREPAVPPTWSERWFSQERRTPAGGTLLASHWVQLGMVAQSSPLPFRLACATLAVRAAQEGIAETPELSKAYLTLARAYVLLGRLESAPLAETGVSWARSIRYFEAVQAARQAARLDPENAEIEALLADLWRDAGRIDAAYQAIDAVLRGSPLSADPSEEQLAQREVMETLQRELADAISEVQLAAEKDAANQTDPVQTAMSIQQAGCIQMSADLLMRDAITLERNPTARHLLTACLLELGAGRELDDSAARLELVGAQSAIPGWQDVVAFTALGRADYVRAIDLWQGSLSAGDENILLGLLFTSPGSRSSPIYLGDAQFPASHLTAIRESRNTLSQTTSIAEMHRGLAELERGNVDGAKTAIERALARAPSSPLRPLLRVYWYCLKGETIDVDPPSKTFDDAELLPAE